MIEDEDMVEVISLYAAERMDDSYNVFYLRLVDVNNNQFPE